MTRSASLFGLSLCALILFGFGCKPGWNDPYYRFRNSTSTRQTLSPSEQQKRWQELEKGLQTIQTAIQNLSNASSFKANIHFPLGVGYVTGGLEFSREQGIHGTLQAPGPVVTELYAVNDQILFKSKDTDWLDVSGTEEGKTVKDQLMSAFLFTADRDRSGLIADASQIEEVAPDRSGCTLYTFVTSGEAPQRVSMCVKNSYPTYIMTMDDDGKVTEIRYRDFNESISFVLPKATKVQNTTSTVPTGNTTGTR